MNFPILYTSTHHLSINELKKYVQNYQDHSISFTIFDNFRLVSYHKFYDELYIRLEWFVQRDKRTDFKIPLDLNSLFLSEDNGTIEFKRGNIVHYSKDDLAKPPSDESYNIFTNYIRDNRFPIKNDEYKNLEFPKYSLEPKVQEEQIFEMTNLHNQFEHYLKNRKNKNKKRNSNTTRKKDKY